MTIILEGVAAGSSPILGILVSVNLQAIMQSIRIYTYNSYYTADVDLFLHDESDNPSVCGEFASFTCIANDTNTVTILQNNIRCQMYDRRNELIGNSACKDLELTVRSAMPDPGNVFLTIFVIDGKQYFQGGMTAFEIECTNVIMESERLQLKVDSKYDCKIPFLVCVCVCACACACAWVRARVLSLCVCVLFKLGGSCKQNATCRKISCSECVEEESFEIEWSPPQCSGFETVERYSVLLTSNEEPFMYTNITKYCICGDEIEQLENYTISITGLNQCGETALLLATCENGNQWNAHRKYLYTVHKCYFNYFSGSVHTLNDPIMQVIVVALVSGLPLPLTPCRPKEEGDPMHAK